METSQERAARVAAEAAAAVKAKAAQVEADKRAAEDPKVAANKAEQERQEAEADQKARVEAAQELAAQNQGNSALLGTLPGGGVSMVTPNAANFTPKSEVVPAVQEVKLETVATAEIGRAEAPWRTFQHQYANANTILPNGKKLIFGGQNGHIGQYTTNVPEQIEHLVDLARTPGSMVTEVRKDSEGRFIVVNDSVLVAEQQAALIDSRKNSAADLDPNVVSARNSLPLTIARDS